MHVLFVIDTWGLIGGTERHAAVVVPALLDRGHRVTVLCRDDHEPDFADVDVVELSALEGTGMRRHERRELAARVRAVGADVTFVSALRNVDALETLVELGPVVRYVHDHTLFCPGLNKYCEDGTTCKEPMGLACLRRYWLQGGCICFKAAGHGNRLVDPLKEIAAKWRELAITQRSARVLTNSNYMRAELLKVGFHPDTTAVLHYFTQSNTPAQPATAPSDETLRFLEERKDPLLFTPARLTLPDKGVDFLLTALGQVRAPFASVVAGSGPAEAWLRQKAVDEGVAERVHFTGWVDSGGIEALYERARIVVCPSVWDEPFGLVGIEAMAHGKPVVAFEVGGIPDWLTDGETGFLVPRQHAAAMARAIDELLADPGRAQAFGARGRELVHERFPRDRHVDGLERALQEAAR